MRVIIRLIKQKILRFDVSMAYSIIMQVLKRLKSLLHDSGGLLLGQVLFLSDMIKKFSTFADFGYEEAYSVRLPSLVQLYDIWMVERS
jgi:hypothetical protein